MSAWWEGVPPAVTRVRCGDAVHRVQWRDGALHALDHADVDGERTLAALGGDPCACIELLDAWTRFAADEHVLVLASRGPADRIASREWGAESDEAHAFTYAPRGAGGASIVSFDAEHLSLLRLPGGLPDRLVATVAANVVERGEVSSRAYAAFYGRVRLVLLDWLGLPDAELALTLADAPTVVVETHVVRAALPFSWLVDVWARGLTTLLGRFTLAARVEDGTYVLSVLTPDLALEELRIAMNPAVPGSRSGT
ncbi:hypothetical protein OJ997_24780 [Solirubrobacter phytolaccae]|uniref:Uncharacterized protein n=1 Tax=Solirubrobacter phytolaccae TaxID=1404360 RepID=A0A9X3NBW6_9ACTN|nr:hypothetical protein [Solirubrobacter phytolaccae]MDA0183548.1 hypothetical protein [Solirubrobacter phytolaccae]